MAAVDPAELVQLLQTVASQRPLTQCITNYVSMDIMANVLLAAKCSPAMVHAVEEVEEFQAIANGLLINMGTLSSQWVQSMKVAAAQVRPAWEAPAVCCICTCSSSSVQGRFWQCM
jgi:hydroxyethylthiazole kinase